jgi:potassium efflux system protein
VTVGNVSGTVSRIRIRATTITDWDHKELIVPNKHFITEQILNWTLSDAIIRVIFPVSVCRGAEVGRVR